MRIEACVALREERVRFDLCHRGEPQRPPALNRVLIREALKGTTCHGDGKFQKAVDFVFSGGKFLRKGKERNFQVSF
jgi:hypothetical protein